MNKNDYINNIYSEELKTDIKGFFSKNNINTLQEEVTFGSVLQGMEYRPDKLAAYYLGNERLGWILDLTNNFNEGIKEYYLGRKIKIPSRNAILKLVKE